MNNSSTDEDQMTMTTTALINNNNQQQQQEEESYSKGIPSSRYCNYYFFCLGTCAWALVNAIFSELPILIRDWCDNDWSIISSIALCISLSNLAPLVWTIVLDAVDMVVVVVDDTNKNCTVVGIGILLVFGIVTSFFFVFLSGSNQQDGFIIFHGKIWILLLSSCSGLVGTMSLVLFYPHAALFSSSNASNSAATATATIPSLANGTAVANFFLALLAMLQHPSSDSPFFSLSTYFGIVSLFFLFSIGGYLGTIGFFEKTTTTTTTETLSAQEEWSVLLPTSNSSSRDNSATAEAAALSETATTTSTTTTAAAGGGDNNVDSIIIRLSVLWDPRFRIPYLVQFLWNGLIFFLPGVVPYAVKSVVDNDTTNNNDNASSSSCLLALSYLTISQLVMHTIGTALTGIIPYNKNNNKKNKKNEDFRLGVGFILALILLWIPLVFQFCVYHPTTNFVMSMVPIALNAILCGWYSYTSTRCFQIVTMRCSTTTTTTDDSATNSAVDHYFHCQQQQQQQQQQRQKEYVSRIMGVLHQLGAMIGSILGFWMVTKLKQ